MEEYLNRIITGDARSLSLLIPDSSVDLVFADPVYDRIEDYLWLANTAARVLKPGGACLLWQGQQWLDKTIIALSASGLAYRWVLGWYASNNMQMVGKIGRNLAPLLWYEKGKSNPVNVCREVVDIPIPGGEPSPFKWAKQPRAVAHYLARFTRPGDVVLDPFCGSGTVPIVCKSLGRNYIAFEIDLDHAEIARNRLRDTQEPLLTESVEEEAQCLLL